MELWLSQCLMRTPSSRRLEATDHLAAERGWDLSGGGDFTPEKAQHIDAVVGGDGMTNQSWIDRFQARPGAKQDVAGPFILIHRPIVLRRVVGKQGVIERVQALGDPVQQSW